MSQADQSVEWYLARDGQQHGPISAAEMSKIIELGYLMPNDLVWRQGFAEWQPASVAFPQKTASDAPPVQPSAPSPAQAPAVSAPVGRTAAATQTPDQGSDAKAQPAFDRGTAAGRASTSAGRTTDPREIIAQEAARREESARRAREGFQPGGPRQPISATPTSATQSSAMQPRTEPHRAGSMTGPRDPSARDPMGQRADPMAPVRDRGPEPQSAKGRAVDTNDEDWDDEAPRRRFPRLAVASLLMIVLLGGGAYALHSTGHLDALLARLTFATKPEKSTPVVVAKPDARKQIQNDYFDNPAQVDQSFQRAALWQLLKAEFPDWYQERVQETARLKSGGKPDKEIAQQLAEQLVALRRKHVTDALAASPRHLKSVASSFLDNLERLSKHSIDACYGFISQGETSPLIVDLTRSSEHTPSLQRQSAAIFSAIAEGRRTPATHKPPTREDYDQLAIQLAKRGWSPIDLQLFSDARSLARATPERVCKMVQDWFAAQLAVDNEDVQVRLLIEALKPVVAG